jgi:hypothetical protein
MTSSRLRRETEGSARCNTCDHVIIAPIATFFPFGQANHFLLHCNAEKGMHFNL